MNQALLRVRNLTKRFPVRSRILSRSPGWFTAVDSVSFDVQPGETLGLVGESGCGKTTTGRMILRLLEPTAGEISMTVDGREINLVTLQREQLRLFRRHVQMVFQDPYSSLDPRMRAIDIIAEPLRALAKLNRSEIADRARDLARSVGLSPDQMRRFPHAFSGGQRQRISIARSLALNPALIVCDEPVSALDVSVRAQIINLLKDLQAERGLSYLFVAHDLSVVENISSRVAVMFAGRIVETAPSATLFHSPRHPYTMSLLDAVPQLDPQRHRERRCHPEGTAEPLDGPPAVGGCPFQSRCPFAEPRCRSEPPPLRTIDDGGTHLVACHFAESIRECSSPK
jgi:oligopeptide/dipeptide ABC transporter ATP-binding protein